MFPHNPSTYGRIHDQTLRIGLHVIAAAGYGYPFDWESSSEVPPRHQMSFRDSILSTLDNLIPILAIPKMILSLPIKSLQNISHPYIEFGSYIQELVDFGKSRLEESRNHASILSALVSHSVEAGGRTKERALRDDEITGNCFIFLLAGHETTYRIF